LEPHRTTNYYLHGFYKREERSNTRLQQQRNRRQPDHGLITVDFLNQIQSRITRCSWRVFWGSDSSAKCGRPALILSEHESAGHGRRAEVTYNIRQDSVQTCVGLYLHCTLNVLAYREQQSVILHLPAHRQKYVVGIHTMFQIFLEIT
jgi:hypothetical protein